MMVLDRPLEIGGVPTFATAEWMGHRDYRTMLIYADYEPGEDESGMVDRAFG